VRDESHLDDMRAAIRGDFERLEQRLGTQELMHVREPAPDEGLQPTPPQELDATLLAGPEPEPEPEAEASPRSWLARLRAAIFP
jgi:hypothetical protein